MPNKLNPRLRRCAGLVSRGGVALDIGTDHAYLACFLVESGVSSHVYASDIADGPLASARQTVTAHGLEDKVTVVKSDGLKSLPDEALFSATDIIIAGMGGELITDILSRGIDSGKLSRSARLILQPNSKAAFLRQFLAENAYEILSETAVRDGRFIYTVICAEYTGRADLPSLAEATVGKLDPRDPTAREYLEKEIKKLRRAANGMSEAASELSRTHAIELDRLADSIENYIKETLK